MRDLRAARRSTVGVGSGFDASGFGGAGAQPLAIRTLVSPTNSRRLNRDGGRVCMATDYRLAAAGGATDTSLLTSAAWSAAAPDWQPRWRRQEQRPRPSSGRGRSFSVRLLLARADHVVGDLQRRQAGWEAHVRDEMHDRLDHLFRRDALVE